MSEKYWSRRHFLKTGALAGAWSLSGCAALDRWALKEDGDDPQRVVILGAGAAGLSAAFRLKKAGLQFRIFEASKRVGGRVLSLKDFNAAAQTADLGAAWFSHQHEYVSALAKELKIEMIEVKGAGLAPSFWIGENFVKAESLNIEFQEGQRILAALVSRTSSEELDRISFREILNRLKSELPSSFILWSERALQNEWGADPSTISGLAASRWIQSHKKSFAQPWTSRNLRLSAGTQALTQALYDRVIGIIPEQNVRLEHRLIRVDASSEYIDLYFDTPGGTQVVRAGKVICALPFSILRGVKGLDTLQLSAMKLKAINELGYGSHSKVAMSFAQRFWLGKNDEKSRWLGEFSSQQLWAEAPLGAAPVTAKALMVAQLGGTAGAQAGLHSVDTVLKDCERIFQKEIPYEKLSQVQNWALHPTSKGSVSYFQPGQFLKFSNLFSSAELKGRWMFAGEHISTDFQATLNGALQTGQNAAQEFIKVRKRS